MRSLIEFFDLRRLADWYRAIVRIRRFYLTNHGVALSLRYPRTFTEKIQWRKLFDLDPRLSVFCDKYRVRAFVAASAGADLLVPMLWIGEDADAVPFDRLDAPYIVKSTHGSGQTIVVTDAAALDIAAATAAMKAWLGTCYADRTDEIGYVPVQPRIIVERCLFGQDGKRPQELRLFVFHGRVHFVLSDRVEDGAIRSDGFRDREWRRIDWYMRNPPREPGFPRPRRLDDMIAVAERLGADIDHLRVDFYDCHDRFYVGELTAYCWSGEVPFYRRSMDEALGTPWRIEHAALRAFWTVLTRRRHIGPMPVPEGDGAWRRLESRPR
jgi:hypothetical protein